MEVFDFVCSNGCELFGVVFEIFFLSVCRVFEGDVEFFGLLEFKVWIRFEFD